MHRAVVLLLLASFALAQEATPAPTPGPVPVTIVTVGKLKVPPQAGDAPAALAAFVDAHEKHKAGKADAALAGYIKFLGIPGRHELPSRYLATVEQRLEPMLKKVRKRYDAAVVLYIKDRDKGIAELTLIAGRYAQLPEGAAACALWHSDRLRDAIDAARVKGRKGAEGRKIAAASLEAAIKRWTRALYRYEAKKLLVELGGPDLLLPSERVGEGGGDTDDDGSGDDDDDGADIEVSDDDD